MRRRRKIRLSKAQRKLHRQIRRYKWRWWRRIGLLVLILLVSAGGFGYHKFREYQATMPKLKTVFQSVARVSDFDRQAQVTYLNDAGQPFYHVSVAQYRPVSLAQVKKSPNVVKALVATEDRDFFHERGVNWLRTLQAGYQTYVKHNVVGGSTITQQLIKLSFFSTKKSDQTVKRKVQEIMLAEKLADKYSKMQILTWYLNRVNYGNGQIGMGAASQYYYGKPMDKLSLFQAATLTGIINSPAMYNPYGNQKLMAQRRRVVLASLLAMHQITKRQFDGWNRARVTKGMVAVKTHQRQLRHQIRQREKYDGFVTQSNLQLQKYGINVSQRDLTVQTTMNQHLQNQVDAIVKAAPFVDNQLETGLVVFDNQTGQVKAMSPGRHRSVINGYSRAVDLNRSSGSSIKPLLDYAPGFDMYHWNASTLVYDTPYTYPGTDVVVHDWDNGHQGAITLKQALVQSRNIPAVRALGQVGLDNGQRVLKALGLQNGPLRYPNAIGINTSPLKMASAYSSLADNGYRVNQRFVTRVVNHRNQKTLVTKPVYDKVFSQSTANQMSRLLQNVFTGQGTATKANINGSHQAGKTGTVGRAGTSLGLTDGWMIGYTKQYTVAVWVGYDNPYSPEVLTNETADVVQTIYRQVMLKVMHLKNNDNKNWANQPPTNTTNDFRRPENRQYSQLPFRLNMAPWTFLGQKSQMRFLPDLYDKLG